MARSPASRHKRSHSRSRHSSSSSSSGSSSPGSASSSSSARSSRSRSPRSKSPASSRSSHSPRSRSPKSKSKSKSESKSKSKSRSKSPQNSKSRSRSRSRSIRSSRRRSPTPISKIHVNRLTKNVNKNHLTEIFETYGPIKSVELPMDRYHPQLGRGTAYIEFNDNESAEKAIKYMDGGQIDGQEITVSVFRRNRMPARRPISRSHRTNGPWRKAPYYPRR